MAKDKKLDLDPTSAKALELVERMVVAFEKIADAYQEAAGIGSTSGETEPPDKSTTKPKSTSKKSSASKKTTTAKKEDDQPKTEAVITLEVIKDGATKLIKEGHLGIVKEALAKCKVAKVVDLKEDQYAEFAIELGLA